MHTTSILVCCAIFAAAVVSAVEVDKDVGLRAASRDRNCGCQCSSLTFKDKYGNINGNCKSTDRTGAVWCYVEPGYSTCSDLRTSSRFNKQWSYEACATPEPTSYECQGYNNGGYNNGGYNNGGYNNGGYNNGGYNNGNNGNNNGYNNGYNNGNNNGYNNGYNNGNNNGYPCRGSSCNTNSGFNNGYGSGSSFNTGSSGYNTGSSLGSILSGGSSNGGYPVRGSTRDGSAAAAANKDAINFEQ